MGMSLRGMDCGVVEWVKCDTQRWFGHVIRMKESEFVKKLYEERKV